MSAPQRLALVEARAELCGRCGHDRDLHTHHHDRTYCGTCGREACPWFKRPKRVRARRGSRPVRQAIVITAALALAPPLGVFAVWLYAQIWGW